MKTDAAMLYAQAALGDEWEQQEKNSDDVEQLRQQYRSLLYSEKGRALLEARAAQSHDKKVSKTGAAAK
jgi:hypothetical protein